MNINFYLLSICVSLALVTEAKANLTYSEEAGANDGIVLVNPRYQGQAIAVHYLPSANGVLNSPTPVNPPVCEMIGRSTLNVTTVPSTRLTNVTDWVKLSYTAETGAQIFDRGPIRVTTGERIMTRNIVERAFCGPVQDPQATLNLAIQALRSMGARWENGAIIMDPALAKVTNDGANLRVEPVKPAEYQAPAR